MVWLSHVRTFCCWSLLVGNNETDGSYSVAYLTGRQWCNGRWNPCTMNRGDSRPPISSLVAAEYINLRVWNLFLVQELITNTPAVPSLVSVVFTDQFSDRVVRLIRCVCVCVCDCLFICLHAQTITFERNDPWRACSTWSYLRQVIGQGHRSKFTAKLRLWLELECTLRSEVVLLLAVANEIKLKW